MLAATLTSKGQITIPMSVRNKFNLHTGNKVEFLLQDNKIIMIPLNRSLQNLKSILPKSNIHLSTEEIYNIIKSKPL